MVASAFHTSLTLRGGKSSGDIPARWPSRRRTLTAREAPQVASDPRRIQLDHPRGEVLEVLLIASVDAISLLPTLLALSLDVRSKGLPERDDRASNEACNRLVIRKAPVDKKPEMVKVMEDSKDLLPCLVWQAPHAELCRVPAKILEDEVPLSPRLLKLPQQPENNG